MGTNVPDLVIKAHLSDILFKMIVFSLFWPNRHQTENADNVSNKVFESIVLASVCYT